MISFATANRRARRLTGVALAVAIGWVLFALVGLLLTVGPSLRLV
jgi:hypothetical protein